MTSWWYVLTTTGSSGPSSSHVTLYVEFFTCLHHVYVTLFQVLWLSSSNQNFSKWLGYVSPSGKYTVCVHHALSWTSIPSRIYTPSCIHSRSATLKNEMTKVVIKDEWVSKTWQLTALMKCISPDVNSKLEVMFLGQLQNVLSLVNWPLSRDLRLVQDA